MASGGGRGRHAHLGRWPGRVGSSLPLCSRPLAAQGKPAGREARSRPTPSQAGMGGEQAGECGRKKAHCMMAATAPIQADETGGALITGKDAQARRPPHSIGHLQASPASRRRLCNLLQVSPPDVSLAQRRRRRRVQPNLTTEPAIAAG